MSAAITCASCNRPLRVPESVLGQTVQCPLCLDEFIARTDLAAEAAARAAAPRRAARPRPIADIRIDAEATQAPLAPIIEEQPAEAVPILEAVPEPTAASHGGPERAFAFPVIVMRDPDRVLRGPMDGELTAEGLYLRKMRYPPAFAAVGAPARYLGANRLVVTVEGRQIELAVAKPWASNYHLARDAAAFLNAQGPFPNAPSYRLPWYLYAIPPLFLALPFAAAPFGLLTDGCLGAFLWTVIALALGGTALIVAVQARLRPRARLITGLSLLGVGAALPLLAIPLTPAYTVDPALWSTFRPTSGEFTVLMPGAPASGASMSLERYQVDVVSPEIHFMVYVAPAPQIANFGNVGEAPGEQAVSEAQALLARDFYLTSSYPSVNRFGSQDGRTYRELFYQASSSSYGNGPYAGKSVAARVYVVNGNVVTLTAMGPRVRLDGADVVKFFNSVQFPPKPQPHPTPPAVQEIMNTGRVTGTAWNQLTIQTNVPGGNQRTIVVPADARVTIDGQPDQVQHIKINSAVTISERDGKVVKVVASSPLAAPLPPAPPADFGKTFSGKVLRVQGRLLTVDDDNFGRSSFVIPNFAPVTIDGMDAHLEDVRAGQHADIFMQGNKVVRVVVDTK